MSNKSTTRRINIYINGKQVQNSMRAIEKEFYSARNAVRKATRGTEEYQNQLKRMREAKVHLDNHRRDLNGISRSWQQFKSIAAGVLGANLIQGALSSMSNFARKLIQNNAKLSDSYADVMKFTGLTRKEVEELSSEFKGFNTRTPRSELLNLAKVAGRMGLEGKNNIKEFVREANQINVALGEDLGENAVLQIGKIAAAFDTNMLKIGSAINTAGQNSRAQEQYLVDFTSRMQGTGVTAGIAASDIIGYGAVLDSLGLKVEMSGTALNNFFIDFVKDTEKFGEAAGFANGELSKLIGEKGTNAGFLAFVEALKEANPEKQKFLKALEDLGINGARGSQVFLALSNNLDEVRRMQALSNDAFEEGTSITEEYNIRNENLAANLERVQQWLHRMFVNSAVMKGAEDLVGWFAKLVEIPLSETLEKEALQLSVLELELYDVNTTSERRIQIIEELQSKYDGYIDNIDAETASNEELSKAIKEVNDMLVNKIVIERQQERINEYAEQQADRREDLLERELEMREKLSKLSEESGIAIRLKDGERELSLLEQASFFYQDLEASKSGIVNKGRFSDLGSLGFDINQLRQSQEAMDHMNQKALEMRQSFADLKADLFGPEDNDSGEGYYRETGKTGESEDPENEQKELQAVKEKFQRRREMVKMMLQEAKLEDEENRLSEEEREQQLWEEKMERTRLGLMTERDIEIELMQAKYEEMKSLAGDNATALIGVEAWKTSQLKAINDKYREDELDSMEELYRQKMENIRATQDAIRASGAFILGLFDFLGEAGENSASFQKARALFQIGINLAEGIAAAAAAGAKNPANPITGGAAGLQTFATLSGLVMSTIGQARQLTSSRQEPRYRRMNREFFVGGHTGLGNPREEAGVVHKGEYVNPNWMVSSPALAPVFESLESIRMAGPSFLQAANQPQVSFDTFNSTATQAGVLASNSVNEEAIGEAVARSMAQFFKGEKGKEQTSIRATVSLTQMREAERELEDVQTLSGFKRN